MGEPTIPKGCPAHRRAEVEQHLAFFGQALDHPQDQSELREALVQMAKRGESFEELLALVLVLRQRMVAFDPGQGGAVDNCGTGGDGLGLFNISTTAAIVAASAGARVVKHGNRSVTGRCGSADLLEAVGIKIDLSAKAAREVLDRENIVFLYAPFFHPALKAVGPLRRSLSMPTIFNLAGPLCNPAGIQRHFLGVAAKTKCSMMADVMQALGYERAYALHGAGGADELTLAGENFVQAVGAAPELEFSAQAAGLGGAPVKDLVGGDVSRNVELLHRVLEAEPGPVFDAVVLNAAGTLVTAGVCDELPKACALATQMLKGGQVKEKLHRWARACAEVSKA